MNLSNDITQKRQPGGAASKRQSSQTNVQLEGFWLYLAQGAWICFMLLTLVVIIMSLVATHGEGYIVPVRFLRAVL